MIKGAKKENLGHADGQGGAIDDAHCPALPAATVSLPSTGDGAHSGFDVVVFLLYCDLLYQPETVI